MKIVLNKNSPLSLREQIKIQIKNYIGSGAIAPGQKLFSARDLALMINVNRNTITQAYKELAMEGFLETAAGSGTIVKKDFKQISKEELRQIFDRAYAEAKQLGFSQEEINNYFFTLIAHNHADISAKTVLIVDCNYEVINYLSKGLTDNLRVKTEGVLIQDIEANPDKSIDHLRDKDLIVCGFNHVQELRRAVPTCDKEIIPILLQPDIEILNYLTKIPPGTHVGYVCANQRSTDTFYTSSFFSGGTELKRILVGLDNLKENKQILSQCDIIFATEFVYEHVKEIVNPTQHLIKIDIGIDANIFDFIKGQLGI